MRKIQAIKDTQIKQFEILCLILVSLLLYGRTVGYGFVWDDKQLIVDNPYFHQKLHILDLFRRSMWSFSSLEFKAPFYRPLLTMTYWIETQIWGRIPAFYHLMNVLMHLTSLCMIWILAFKWGLSRAGRWLACILFSIHPVQVPTVSFISCHADLMVQVLSLLALILWMKDTRIRWLALVCVLCAMLVKEAAVILPLILMAYDFLVGKKNWRKVLFWVPAALWPIYFGLRWWGLRNSDPVYPQLDSSLLGGGAFRTFEYFSRILFPIPASVNLSVPRIQFWAGIYILILLIFMAISIFTKTKNAKILFLWVWFLMTFAIISDWIGQNLRFSDQLIYISMAPFCLLAGSIRISSKKIIAGVGTLLMILFLISNSQIGVWKNNYEFWKNEMKFYPGDPEVVLGYVTEYIVEKNPENPCELYSQVRGALLNNYKPQADYLLNFDLGNCHLPTDPALAEKYYRTAAGLSRRHWMVKNNLAAALIKQGKYDEVLKLVQETTEEAPYLAIPWKNLGAIYARFKRYPESLQALEHARQIDPDNIEIHRMIEEVSNLQDHIDTSKRK